jgi:hypothetical protein
MTRIKWFIENNIKFRYDLLVLVKNLRKINFLFDNINDSKKKIYIIKNILDKN